MRSLPHANPYHIVFALASVATLIVTILSPGCGSGGGEAAPTGISNTSSTTVPLNNYAVTGDTSLTSRAAAKGLLYGAATKTSALADTAFSKAFAAECGMLVPETELKWNVLRPTPDSFDFSAPDALLAFAQSHHMLFRGHTLVWHSALPAWFHNTVTPANAEEMLRSHIATVVGRYAGKMHSWDVVNEAVEPGENGPNGLRTSSPWYKLLGSGYIETAFRAAAAADPTALLVYNESGLDYDTPKADDKRAAVLNLLKILKAKDVPIHALGIQAHLNSSETHFNPGKLRSFLREVAALGLKIMITEMDVTDQYLPADFATRDGMVADTYSQYLKVVLDEPAVIAVLTWGLSDSYTWLSDYSPRPDGSGVRPLPIDNAMNKKMAWNAIANALDTARTR